jgi:hypothetical protein
MDLPSSWSYGPVMRYWRHSKFWVVFAVTEVAAYLLAAICTMMLFFLAQWLHGAKLHDSLIFTATFLLIFAYLSYDAFWYSRRRAMGLL